MSIFQRLLNADRKVTLEQYEREIESLRFEIGVMCTQRADTLVRRGVKDHIAYGLMESMKYMYEQVEYYEAEAAELRRRENRLKILAK